MFLKLTPQEKEILNDIKMHVNLDGYCDDIESYWAKEDVTKKRRYLLSLREKGYIKTDIIGGCELLTKAYTYAEDEIEYERQNSVNNFYGDASHIQIQQNTSNSSQSMNISNELDFEKIIEIFEQILHNLKSFNLSSDDEKHLENIVNETLPIAEAKTNVPFIKKTLPIIKDILIRTTSSLTASGILYMLSQMGV